MNFLSLFSGIEAASVAWEPLGWKAAAFAEIDPFASAVLAHHYPDVPNLGDVEKANIDAIGHVDLVVGGSPCQSFSIAGKRLGLDDARGNLALVYGQVVYRKRPRWFVFENVPGLLSSDSGWDFGTLLAAFAGHAPGSVFEPPKEGWRNAGFVKEASGGYGLAWRVLDAQYCRVYGFGRAVPQRRRRVFVVGYLGDWRRAAAVLFERESLLGNPPPRRQAGQRTAPTLAARTRGGGGLGTAFDCDGGLIANALTSTGSGVSGPDLEHARANHLIASPIAQTLTRGAESAGKGGYAGRRQEDDVNLVAQATAPTLDANYGKLQGASGQDLNHGHGHLIAFGGNNTEGAIDVATACRAKGGSGHGDFESETFVAHALRADGFDASEDGTGRGTPLVPVVMPILEPTKRTGVSSTSIKAGDGIGDPGDPMFTLQAGAQHGVAIAFDETQITSATNRCQPKEGDPSHPLAAGARPPTIAFHARQDPDHGPVTHPLDTDGTSIGIFTSWRVRRLMPVECERLQGFPDGYTAIPYRGKPAADGPRYKGLGNSMAVNVMRWIGHRIAMVDKL